MSDAVIGNDPRLADGLDRRAAMRTLLDGRGDLLLVTGLGSTTYDAAAVGDDSRNFYLWGAMGAAALIGLGLASARPERRVLAGTGGGGMGASAFRGWRGPAASRLYSTSATRRCSPSSRPGCSISTAPSSPASRTGPTSRRGSCRRATACSSKTASSKRWGWNEWRQRLACFGDASRHR